MNLNRFLQITPVKHTEFLLFGLKVFSFFKTSKNKNILLLGIPKAANSLIIFPYIFKFGLLNMKRKRYFVRMGSYLVGTFSVAETPISIHVYSLTVNPKWRQLGIASYVLNYIEEQAIHTKKSCLEISVHKTNNSAIRLYRNFGFVKIGESRWFFNFKKIIINN